MISPSITLERDNYALGSPPVYYYVSIVMSSMVKALSLDGIKPCKETIKNDTYPYVTEVMGSVRSDIDKSSTAYQLFYNLSIGKYNNIIDESGYVVRTKK